MLAEECVPSAASAPAGSVKVATVWEDKAEPSAVVKERPPVAATFGSDTVAVSVGRNRPSARRRGRRRPHQQPVGDADRGDPFLVRCAPFETLPTGCRSRHFGRPAWLAPRPASSAYRPAPCDL